MPRVPAARLPARDARLGSRFRRYTLNAVVATRCTPAGKSIDCDSAALLGDLPALDCPYCTKPPVQFLQVSATELARNYEDSPAVAQKLASRIPDKAPGAPSPLKTGDTYDDMKVHSDPGRPAFTPRSATATRLTQT